MSKGLKGKNHGNNQWTLPVEVQHRRQIFLMVLSGHFQQVSRGVCAHRIRIFILSRTAKYPYPGPR